MSRPDVGRNRASWNSWSDEYQTRNAPQITEQMSSGDIRLFTSNGLAVQSLIEPRPEPDAVSTYRDAADRAWSGRWPGESLWRCPKG